MSAKTVTAFVTRIVVGSATALDNQKDAVKFILWKQSIIQKSTPYKHQTSLNMTRAYVPTPNIDSVAGIAGGITLVHCKPFTVKF